MSVVRIDKLKPRLAHSRSRRQAGALDVDRPGRFCPRNLPDLWTHGAHKVLAKRDVLPCVSHRFRRAFCDGLILGFCLLVHVTAYDVALRCPAYDQVGDQERGFVTEAGGASRQDATTIQVR